jgi:hypothetical protein
MSNFNGPRKSVTIGDVLKSTKKGTDEPVQIEKDGQLLDSFSLKVYIPDDVDQAGIGQPSLVITKDMYINMRVHSDKEVSSMPDWKQKTAQLKAWINLSEKK